MRRTFLAVLMMLLMTAPAAMAQTGFCKSCAQMDNSQRTAEIRKMYSEIINNKNLTSEVFKYTDEDEGLDYNYIYRFDNGKLVEIDYEIVGNQNTFFYVKDGCLFFCLHQELQSDNVGKTLNRRAYFCNDKIYKFIDSDQTERKVNDSFVQSFQQDLLNDYSEALRHLENMHPSAQTGFCKSCAQMDNNQRTAEIRKMYSETANNKNLTTKKYQYEFDENGQGFPYSFVYRYDNEKLVQIDFETEYDYIHRRFFYAKDGCLYFVLVEDQHPSEDGSQMVSEFSRAYFCNDKIYKCLGSDKKDLNVKDAWVVDLQIELLEDFTRALEMEGKAE
ncbi:MAG: hypothetical protein II852_08765 [Bacteroidales bacterium]|nr:hypothetical protein [Bacteroidales bacterium]